MIYNLGCPVLRCLKGVPMYSPAESTSRHRTIHRALIVSIRMHNPNNIET
jgi:hypothetical protein